MISGDNSVTIIRDHLNKLIGDVTSKNLFTGHGLFYKKEDMFAIWLSGKLYLRAENELADKLNRLGCTQFVSIDFNKRYSLMHYHELSAQVLADNKLLKNLIYLSLIQIKDIRVAKELEKANRIKELPNLTIKHERALKKIGVTTVDELRQCGAIKAIIELKKIGVEATEVFYWKLVGALEGRHYLSYSEEEKKRKLEKLNEALSENGFRRCKRKLKPVDEK